VGDCRPRMHFWKGCPTTHSENSMFGSPESTRRTRRICRAASVR
jgi:uncharacterized beta-barrel protein YwiB (DUF1934 family)